MVVVIAAGRRLPAAGLAAVAVAAAVGCDAGGREQDEFPDCAPADTGSVAIEVDNPVAPADQAVHITVTGLDPGQPVAVTAQTADWQQDVWRAYATFTADDAGTVDLTRVRPESGTYQGVDGMGLFWSMHPPAGEPHQAELAPLWPEAARAFEVELAACVGTDQVASATLTREWMPEDAVLRPVDLPDAGVVGQLYLPPDGVDAGTGVLLLGGSDGGVPHRYEAALLASQGHPTLALAYFGEPDLPDELQDIPLEYFAQGAELLATETGSPVAVLGYSRGGEPALLLAQHYPELVRGAVVYAGSNEVFGSFPSDGVAWTRDGATVPREPIPLDQVAGPILAIAGDDDASFWPADNFAELIQEECESAQSAHACEALIYPDAGHLVGTFPFLPSCTVCVHPVSGEAIDWGGTREANEAARRDGWSQVLTFLAER